MENQIFTGQNVNPGSPWIGFLILLVGFMIPLGAHPVLPDGFVLEVVTDELKSPTAMTFAPDGRMFIAEKGGAIRIIEKDILLPEPFYTVVTETPNERGLNGIALHPDFDNNQQVYLYYSILDDRRNKLARVIAAGNTALPESEIELMTFGKMWGSWHNGGAMLFGDDGKLYLSIGDGTAGVNAPKFDWLLGKILRLNPDGSIPNDNPFLDQTEGDHQAIAAYGIRNPYTMARSKSTGRIFFCDVGNNLYEEINEYIPGGNYGWNRVEGLLPAGTSKPDEAYIDPLYAYDHADDKCAIVGAAFYEPEELLFPTEYHGKFFFMDYCAGVIFTMDPNTYEVDTFATGFDRPNNLAIGDDGHLYVMKLKTGELFRISYQGSGVPYISRQPKARNSIPNESITLEVSASGDPELKYDWMNGTELLQSGESDQFVMPNIQLSDNGKQIHCLVSNSLGSISSDTVTLNIIDGSRPQISIHRPLVNTHFSALDTIWFEANVEDPDEEMLDPSGIMWQIDFHHDDHTHPAKDPKPGLDGYYVVGQYGEVDTNIYYRVLVEVTDRDGLVSQDYRDVYPNIVQMELHSDPVGISVGVDGSSNPTNHTLYSLDKQKRVMEAPIYDIVDDHFYAFTVWENGDSQLIRTIEASEGLEFGLTYADSGYYHTGNNTALRLRVYEGLGEDTVFYKEQRQHQVDANWDVQSPYRWDGVFPDDEYSILYRGMLVPPISAEYTLHFLHDGYLTLQLGDSILLDRVEDDSDLTETDDVTVYLEGGKKYPFFLFYEHVRYVARIQASWSFSVVERQVIPERHFEKYDPQSTSVDTSGSGSEDLAVRVFPNPVSNGVLQFEIRGYKSAQVDVVLTNSLGQEVLGANVPLLDQVGQLDIPSLTAGLYYMRLSQTDTDKVYKFVVTR